MSTQDWLYLPDIHTPLEDKATMAAVEQYAEDTQPHGILIGGDYLNLDCISSHNLGKLRLVENQRIYKDVEYANVQLDRFQERCGGVKEWVYLEGNHEFRLNRYVDAHPELEGILEVPRLLRLPERGIKWVPSWSKGKAHKIGKALFIHGTSTADGHAKAMVQMYGDNVFYGHTHDVQSYSKKTRGDDKTRIGQSLGCLCSYEQAYMKGTPNRWQQAFGLFRFFDDGFFNHYVVNIFKHRFISPEGWSYNGTELLKGIL